MSSKNSRFFIPIVAVLVVIMAFWIGFAAYPYLEPRLTEATRPSSVQTTLSREQYLQLSGQIYDTVTRQYYKKVNGDSLLKGQAASLGDPYTELFTPVEAADFRDQLAGEYVGIGVVISYNKTANAVQIIRIFDGAPAEKSGLKPGDLIDSVSGHTARGLSLDTVSAQVKGKAGTSVQLRVERAGKFLDFTITRQEVALPVVEENVIGKNVGYISVSSFSSGVAAKFTQALHRLENKKVRGIVIDIRDNGGGYLNECLDMLADFIKHGTALWTQQAGGQLSPIAVSGSSVSFPVVVLVNENSASASEIFSAAMKENKVALIVGTTTYGKGLIQRTWNLSSGYELKVTVEEYYTPNKNTIQKKGLAPDIFIADPVPGTFGTLPGDAQLKRAVQLIEEGRKP